MSSDSLTHEIETGKPWPTSAGHRPTGHPKEPGMSVLPSKYTPFRVLYFNHSCTEKRTVPSHRPTSLSVPTKDVFHGLLHSSCRQMCQYQSTLEGFETQQCLRWVQVTAVGLWGAPSAAIRAPHNILINFFIRGSIDTTVTFIDSIISSTFVWFEASPFSRLRIHHSQPVIGTQRPSDPPC